MEAVVEERGRGFLEEGASLKVSREQGIPRQKEGHGSKDLCGCSA